MRESITTRSFNHICILVVLGDTYLVTVNHDRPHHPEETVETVSNLYSTFVIHNLLMIEILFYSVVIFGGITSL